jgi:hypothetical protein
MSVELDQEALRIYVIFRHPSLPMRRDVPPRGDPELVANLAARHTVKVLGGICDGDQCQVATCAGLLVYGMDGYGLSYEEVCQVASQRVAEVLRQITPDNRLTDPQRNFELRSRLGQADPTTLVVKLAEIEASTKAAKTEYGRETLAARASDLKNWADRTVHLFQAMRTLRELPKMRADMDEAQRAVVRLAQDAEAARDAGRQARAAARRDKQVVIGSIREAARPAVAS